MSCGPVHVSRCSRLQWPAACCVFVGLMILEATSAFWTTESLEVWNAFTYGGVTMSQYPLEIYRPWFRRFFIFVIPLGCINYLPGVAILGRPDPLGTPLLLQWASPLSRPDLPPDLSAGLEVWRAALSVNGKLMAFFSKLSIGFPCL